MADASLATRLLREIPEPLSRGESIKTVLDRTSRIAKLSYWRTFDIWYGKARRIEDHEFEQIQTALRIKRESATRNELHDLKLRLARLEALLRTQDADFHRPDIDFTREMLSEPGRKPDRPVARKR